MILNFIVSFTNRSTDGVNNDEAQAKEFLEVYDKEYSRLSTESIQADWNYNTNLTDENAAIVVVSFCQIYYLNSIDNNVEK